jgi:hypothetical protein
MRTNLCDTIYTIPLRRDRIYVYGVVTGGATTSGSLVYAYPAKNPNATAASMPQNSANIKST